MASLHLAVASPAITCRAHVHSLHSAVDSPNCHYCEPLLVRQVENLGSKRSNVVSAPSGTSAEPPLGPDEVVEFKARRTASHFMSMTGKAKHISIALSRLSAPIAVVQCGRITLGGGGGGAGGGGPGAGGGGVAVHSDGILHCICGVVCHVHYLLSGLHFH
ncbi:uncharacterized protein A4U43_C07F19440 [Asparagus officinalis]|uniref:Uncharacterized protein n=1 Tax=Asparagus officinalis TaxID=4686 RepID=A0A5P1ED69_ASPOF|nr:uncharacterized protein A4U43_C07F19440 [Asparagus officinalis]